MFNKDPTVIILKLHFSLGLKKEYLKIMEISNILSPATPPTKGGATATSTPSTASSSASDRSKGPEDTEEIERRLHSLETIPLSDFDSTRPKSLSPSDCEVLESKLRSLETLNHTDSEADSTILWEDCTQEMYDQIFDYIESSGRRTRVDYIGGRVIISELGPAIYHENAAAFFTTEVGCYNKRKSDDSSFPLTSSLSATYELSDDNGKKSLVMPDAQFRFIDRHCPNVIVEVGNTQTLPSLCEKAESYIRQSTNIMLVCAVKIYRNRALLFLLYQRPPEYFGMRIPSNVPLTPILAISFGPVAMTAEQIEEFAMSTGMPRDGLRGFYDVHERFSIHDLPCAGRNQAPYMVRLPHYLLFSKDDFGTVDREYSAYGDLEFDLFQLQGSIIRDMPK